MVSSRVELSIIAHQLTKFPSKKDDLLSISTFTGSNGKISP